MSKQDKIESIFHKALDLSGKQRKEFLETECAGDAELYSEIEALLVSFEDEAGFLDEPAFELGLAAIYEQTKKDLSGEKLGNYQIEKKIGAGGMGEVYKAFDSNLNRPVALKFLSAAVENDPQAKRQLVREAQAAAVLEHPNICTIYGFEQVGDYRFIVMHYFDGKTLDEALRDKKPNFEEFKKIAGQIISAVAFAHSHDVLHRDLKPGNIMLNDTGQIKILDFGLAKVLKKNAVSGELDLDSRISTNGLIIGTVAYMSPEQLCAEKLDFRSDIFSLGIIFYEMLTGENPYKNKSQAETIAALLYRETAELEKIKQLPANLQKFIGKCLEKSKEKRFQSATEMLIELEKLENGNSAETQVKTRAKLWLASLTLIFLAIVLFAAGSFYYKANRPKRGIAVLPFKTETQQTGNEYLAEGLTQNVIEKLTDLSDLDVKNQYFVAPYKNKPYDPLAAGRELKVDAVLTGTLRETDEGIKLETKIIRISDGAPIDLNEISLNETKLIELPETIANRLITKVNSNLTDEDKKKIAKKDTTNEEAKKYYFVGRFHLNRRIGTDLQNAEINFKKALELDPSFARAWASLADTYSYFSVPGSQGLMKPEEAVTLARAAAKNAIDRDESLCEPYNSLGIIKQRYEWDWQGAEDYFKKAIDCNEEFPLPHAGLSMIFVIKGDFEKALEEARKAKEFDPFSASTHLNLIAVNYFKQDYAEMEKGLNESIEKFPDNKRLQYFRGLMLLETGKISEAEEIFEKLYLQDKVLGAAPLGLTYGKAGKKNKITNILRDLDEIGSQNPKNYISAQEKAIIYIGLGDLNRAFENLERACSEKFSAFPYTVIDPIFEELKNDARFAEIRKCAKI